VVVLVEALGVLLLRLFIVLDEAGIRNVNHVTAVSNLADNHVQFAQLLTSSR
jgi:hypothetical protein